MKKKRVWGGSWMLLVQLERGTSHERFAILKILETRIARWSYWWARGVARRLRELEASEPDYDVAKLSEAVRNKIESVLDARYWQSVLDRLARILAKGIPREQLTVMKQLSKNWDDRYASNSNWFNIKCLLDPTIYGLYEKLTDSKDLEIAQLAEETLKRFEEDAKWIGKPPPKGILLGKKAEAMIDAMEAAKAKEGSA